MTLTASARSISTFIGLFFASLFWNGIVSVFVSIAVAALWANLIGPVPDWLPIPGGLKQGKPVMNDEPMNLGMAFFMCLFLIPFVTIGIGLLVGALLSLLGRTKVVIDQVDSYVLSGIGLASYKQRFDPLSILSVHFNNFRGDGESAPKSSIQLIGDRTIEFGSMLSADRRQWMAAHLQEIFSPNAGTNNSSGRGTSSSKDYSALTWLRSKAN